ncbi:putative integral membrane protein [Theileria parva strain Muguga]|uniref:putative integral membrane protein n=1 Tax=Theileria parva strain Muguga TaxID=333668 RepID=UPI001C61AC0A|nr:putative integral membrane protein [Theileria parva strain Muguga]EAN30459.2 putative integral membrane protein [Theileria parva strain Muguga]
MGLCYYIRREEFIRCLMAFFMISCPILVFEQSNLWRWYLSSFFLLLSVSFSSSNRDVCYVYPKTRSQTSPSYQLFYHTYHYCLDLESCDYLPGYWYQHFDKYFYENLVLN